VISQTKCPRDIYDAMPLGEPNLSPGMEPA